MSKSLSNPSLKVMGSPMVISGYIHGFHHPSLLVVLTVQLQKNSQWVDQADKAIADVLLREFGEKVKAEPVFIKSAEKRIVHSLLFWTGKLLNLSGFPVFEQGKIIGELPELSVMQLAVPTASGFHDFTSQVFLWLLNMYNEACSGKDIRPAIKDLPALVKRHTENTILDMNTLNFVRAAVDTGVPFSMIADNTYRFGYGSRSRLISSSFTDETSVIATNLAHIKTAASQILRRIGLPVPDQRVVSSIKEAEQAAADFGFPVVVKPADLCRGIGVSAGLETIDDVRKAFVKAREESKNIILEKHVHGHDYRLMVFQGKLIWAVERIPGGVTGDGISTITELVNRVNRNPNRSEGMHTPLERIVIDEEAKAILAKRGMNSGSIPANNEFIQLRGTANIARGGTPSVVFDRVHPDNALLAVRAASALRLDLAGIDLLSPDISVSWKENGAAICEINAQPIMGGITTRHLFPMILHALVKGSGRIPVVVIVGASPQWDLAGNVAQRLSDAGLVPGTADHAGVRIGGSVVAETLTDIYTGGIILVNDPGVDALLLCVNDTSIVNTGLPFERFDLLVVAGADIETPDGQPEEYRMVQLNTLFDFISPCCDGQAVIVSDTGAELLEPVLTLPERLPQSQITASGTVDLIVSAMLEASAKHRSGQENPDTHSG
jgi:cyanophycin synthetase